MCYTKINKKNYGDTLGKLFDTDNWLWRWMGRLPDLLALSLLWLLGCIGIVTILPSCIALYDSIAHCIRGHEGGMYRRFFRTFRQEIKRGILLSILWIFLALVLYCGYNAILSGAQSNASSAFSLVYLTSMVFPLATLCWLIPLQSRFSYGFWELHRTAVLVAFAHLPTTAVLLALFGGGVTLVLNIPVLAVLMPAILVSAQTLLTERVLKKLMPEEE